MSLISISETQLSFGYLHSFLNVRSPIHFIIPSIRQEGGRVRFAYPGADVVIDNNHLIQFKRPFYFTTNGIKEFRHNGKPSDIDPPYFRFYVKNDDPTNQFNNLIRATHKGLDAQYISPLFFDERTFFNLIVNDLQHIQSYAHIDIAQFDGMQGTIGRNDDHTIIYNQDSVASGFCYCYSNPKRIKSNKFNFNMTEKKTGKKFVWNEIIEVLISIFFPKSDFIPQDASPLQQCMILQQRLLIEKNIIWAFNYNSK